MMYNTKAIITGKDSGITLKVKINIRTHMSAFENEPYHVDLEIIHFENILSMTKELPHVLVIIIFYVLLFWLYTMCLYEYTTKV